MTTTTINGQRVQVLDRFITSNDGVNCIEAITVRGDHQQRWPTGTEVALCFPDQKIVGRVLAVVPKHKDTELRVQYRQKKS
jgi:hypothetical protein